MSPAHRDFRIGPLSFRIDAGWGMLRSLRFHGHEVIRGIYPAVRDTAWGTLAPAVGPMTVSEDSRSTRISLQARIASAGVELEWHAEIEANADGQLGYRWRARAGSAFKTNRAGLCVLHPAEAAGAPCRIEHADGRVEAGAFPSSISPHQPFTNIRSITHRFAPGAEATVRMEGEVFEMEDQRNWTDASFKTYCRPLDWPRPYEVARGQQIEHTVMVVIAGNPPPVAPLSSELTLIADATNRVALPRIGFGLPGPLPPALRARARALRPAHLRVETTAAELDATLRWAREEADALGCALELAIRGASDAALPPESLPADSSVLLFDADGNTAEPTCISAWRSRGHQRVGTGTLNHFAELNRVRPSAAGAHTLTNFGINAQVHAFDDASLIETVTQHAVVARHAHVLAAPRAVSVSPIVLGPRADSPDPRLHSPFGALWTLASLAQLTSAGVGHATYFRLHGPGGFLRPDEPTPLEHLFRALAGASHVEPISVGGFAPGDAAPIYALLIASGTGRRLLVAHPGESSLDVTVPFFGLAQPLSSLQSRPFAAGAVQLTPRSVWQLALSA